jgi:hypothetical protein
MGADSKIMSSRMKRGQATILVAGVIVVFLLVFLVVGIDFARIYYVRGELQNAADAAALAGARLLGPSGPSLLDTGTNYQQIAARQAAWQYACRNRAAQQNVFLEQMGSCTPGSDVSCCDTPPTSGLNETNADGGDIVVGYWNGSTSTFVRADGTTGNPINAVKVRDQRMAGLQSTGRGSVGLLFGKLVGWSVMDVRRQAIGVLLLRPLSPSPLCLSTCGTSTPLTAAPGLPPGIRYFLKNNDGPPFTGWTSFLENQTNETKIRPYLDGTKTVPNICQQCIYTTQGSPNIACELRKKIRNEGEDYTVNGVTVHGWKALVPVLANDPMGCQAKAGCFFDDNPQTQPDDAFYVLNFAEVIITGAVPETNHCSQDDPGPYPGKPGLFMVGLGSGPSGFSTIECKGCDDPTFNPFFTVKLVK